MLVVHQVCLMDARKQKRKRVGHRDEELLRMRQPALLARSFARYFRARARPVFPWEFWRRSTSTSFGFLHFFFRWFDTVSRYRPLYTLYSISIYLSIYLSIYYILFSHHGDINISDNDDDNNTLIIQKSSSRKDPFCGSDCVSAGSSRKDE